MAAVVAALIAVAYLNDQRGAAEDDLLNLRAQKLRAESQDIDLGEQTFGRSEQMKLEKEELATRQEELAKQAGDPEPSGFPSRREALDLSQRLIAFAAEREMERSRFDTGQTVVPFGEAGFPAVSYTLTAKGVPDNLIGLLDIVGSVITAKIGTLEITRDEAEPEFWSMTLALVVVYAEAG